MQPATNYVYDDADEDDDDDYDDDYLTIVELGERKAYAK